MPNLKSSEIVEHVREVLLKATSLKGSRRCFVTALQILERLPLALRDRLIAEGSVGEAGSRGNHAAPSVVSDAAALVPGVATEFIDCRGLSVTIGGVTLTPSSDVCCLYRIDGTHAGRAS